jgi:hypothetical protein
VDQIAIDFDKPQLPERPRFDGADYVPQLDDVRLKGQLLRIWELMKDHRWRSLHEIAVATKDPEASISAQLRHLRKERFGNHVVDRRRRAEGGTYEYRVL